MRIRKADGRPGVAVVNDIGKVIARFYYHKNALGEIVDNGRTMAKRFIKDLCNGCEYLGRCEGDNDAHTADYCPKNRIRTFHAKKRDVTGYCSDCTYFEMCLKNSDKILCDKHRNLSENLLPDGIMWAGFFWAREREEEHIPDLQGPGHYVKL